ncbi:hypothetical protein ACP70R_049342 [Stipagrostis hirtigluma subsp. patula]
MAAPNDGCSSSYRNDLLGAGMTMPAAGASPEERSSGASTCTTLRRAGRRPPPRRRPKRTSFPCLSCGKTFPTQQAMAGHCSTHTRARLAGQLQLPPAGNLVARPAALHEPSRLQVQCRRLAADEGHHGRAAAGGQGGHSAISHAPAVLPYTSYLPFVHSVSNQVARAPVPVGIPVPNPGVWTAAHQIEAAQAAAQLGWATVFRSCTVLPVPCNATGAAPSPYPARQQPGRARVADPTLRLGSGGGGDRAEKRALVPLLQERRECKRAVVVADGGDHGGNQGKGIDGLDLELRL